MRKLWVAFLAAALLVGTWGGMSWASGTHSTAQAPAHGFNIKGCNAKGKISFMFWGNKGDRDAQHKSVKLAEKSCPGLKVTELWHENGYDTALATAIGSGNAPDLFQLDGAKYIPQYVTQNALAKLDSFVKRDKIDMKKTFVKGCLGEMSYKGHLYGMMRSCGNQDMLYYNKDIFDAKNVKYPTAKWTYADFRKAAVKLSGNYSIKSDTESKLRFGYAWNNDEFRYQPWAWHYGGDWLSKDLKKCTLTDPKVQKAYQWWIDLRNKYHGAPTAQQANTSGNYFDGFKNQYYGMTFAGAWALNYMFNLYPGSTQPPVKFRWGVTLMPKGPVNRQGVMAGTAEVISTRSKNKNAAWWLARFVTQGPGAVIMASYGTDVPGALALYKEKAVQKEYGKIMKQVLLANKFGRSPRLVPQYQKFVDTINKSLEPMWKGDITVAAGTKAACGAVQDLLP